MKPSEKKEGLVKELDKLYKTLDVIQLYTKPRQKPTNDWLADTASVLKNLDEGDYQEFVRLSKTITPTEQRENRKSAAYEIKAFVGRKVAEWKRYDFSGLDERKDTPRLSFGQAGKSGQAGSGGSIFIQAENLSIGGGGRISADGGDVIRSGERINFGTLNQQVAGTVNNISELTRVVSESSLDESEKRQLIGDIETVKAQIIKPKPDKKILQKAWGVAKGAATIGGAAQLVKMIREAILPFLK